MGYREMRKRAGLKVADVTKALDVTASAVYQWETGATDPTAENIRALAAMYNCTIDELMRKE